MTNSFLRKKSRRNANTSNDSTQPDNTDTHPPNRSKQQKQQNIHHSLSLPDLTTPLLDPASWEELPVFTPNTHTHNINNLTHPTTPRARKISITSKDPNSPIQFHRPFTPWQVVNPPLPIMSGMEIGDFRKSAMNWGRGRDSGYTTGSGVSGMKRRGKGKGVGKLNLVVVGGKGVGKSSLANLLLRSMGSGDDVAGLPPDGTNSSTTLPPSNTTEIPSSTPATLPIPYPTTRPTSHTILTTNPSFEKTQLRISDTPGLELGEDDILKEKERERGMAGLMRLLEERFAIALKAESRVVRRKIGGEDDLVHLVIYIIDARSVLRPAQPAGTTRIDWSCVGVFDESANTAPVMSSPVISPHVSNTEIGIIRKLATRANVLPILGHVDSLTITELAAVRHAVRHDLDTPFAGKGGSGFGIFGLEDDVEDTPVNEHDDPDIAPTPIGMHDPRLSTAALRSPSEFLPPYLPYAIFAPEEVASGARRYAWGNADVLDPGASDFLMLQKAIFGIHTKTLRESTREVLYEEYRTEMLLANQTAKVPLSEREKVLRAIQEV